MNTVRIGVIGVGNMGSAHVQTIGRGQVNGLQLTAAADIDAARLEWVKENFPGVACYSSAQALLESGSVDAVVIAVPHWFHPDIAIQAMEKGLHVLTEKPAGVSVSQVQRMNEVHARTGRVFGIMFNQRTNQLFAQARQLVQSGQLGQPKRLVWIITNWYRSQPYYDSGAWRASWRGEGGGVLLNQAPHNLDLWQWIFGMPSRIRAFCDVGKYHHIEVEDDATIYAEYENGARATFITTTGEYPGTNRLEISGDRGKLVLEDGVLKHWQLDRPERAYCFDAPGTPPPAVTYTETRQTEPESAHRGILQNFADAILHGTPLLAPGEDGLRELSLSNAAYLSSWREDWVTLPLDADAFDHALAERVRQSTYAPSTVTPEATDGKYKTRWSVQW